MTKQGKITVSRMEIEERVGDWHDAPARWEVRGPGNELQRFSTKREALKYASLRRRATNQASAGRTYVLTAA